MFNEFRREMNDMMTARLAAASSSSPPASAPCSNGAAQDGDEEGGDHSDGIYLNDHYETVQCFNLWDWGGCFHPVPEGYLFQNVGIRQCGCCGILEILLNPLNHSNDLSRTT